MDVSRGGRCGRGCWQREIWEAIVAKCEEAEEQFQQRRCYNLRYFARSWLANLRMDGFDSVASCTYMLPLAVLYHIISLPCLYLLRLSFASRLFACSVAFSWLTDLVDRLLGVRRRESSPCWRPNLADILCGHACYHGAVSNLSGTVSLRRSANPTARSALNLIRAVGDENLAGSQTEGLASGSTPTFATISLCQRFFAHPRHNDNGPKSGRGNGAQHRETLKKTCD